MRHVSQTFLFLQAHPSSFTWNLAKALEAKGCRVLKINFCFGDWIYWLGRPAVNYRGHFEQWEQFLSAFIEREGVTDVLYYGDCKPYHLVAQKVATSMGVRALVYEFGYLRPDWITLERDGMSTRSRFPNDPERIREVGSRFGTPDMIPRHTYSMVSELTHEIFYNLSSYFMSAFFFRYRSDRYYNPLIEYLTGIPKQFAARANHRRAEAVIDRLTTDNTPFYLYSLQLQSDYQLRYHADFEHQSDAIHSTMSSFAHYAAPDAHLVFKCHPLDNNGEGWPGHIKRSAEQFGVSDRVHYIDGGNLAEMLATTRGCIMINSTVGMLAIARGCPTKVLGGALFDIVGLTHQGGLDSFWQMPEKPEVELANALVRALAGTIQVKGNFFSKDGQAAAIPAFVERLTTADAVNGAGAFVEPPPRAQPGKQF